MARAGTADVDLAKAPAGRGWQYSLPVAGKTKGSELKLAAL
jgi:hypothetical protein